jgi:hypothetical protein
MGQDGWSAASTAARTWQLARWSLTTPQACIPAYTVVGPTNRKPAFFSRLDSAADSGVDGNQSAVETGTV